MHSWTFRLNAIFTFTVTVLAVLSALNALSVAFLNPEPIATIDNVKLQRLPGSGWVSHAHSAHLCLHARHTCVCRRPPPPYTAAANEPVCVAGLLVGKHADCCSAATSHALQCVRRQRAGVFVNRGYTAAAAAATALPPHDLC